MTDLIGRTLGHYRIVDKIGAGGMGEVYRATDQRLDRDIAIKVLPVEVANDEARLARFEREAKLLASLNHQNIATLHGLEEHDGQGFLVMELAEGTDLAHRIALRPIPIDEALDYACQIAEGLEAAHEKGIIHRDLKPANIMLSSEGGIKILDFGLAKAFEPPGSEPSSQDSIADSPTLTAAMTGTGVLLGTAAYMSPEQARGKAVDKRVDIWAFGCVLFEMLTGNKAFEGDDASQTMASILRDEPDWEALPPATPAHIRRLLKSCLVKKPHDRLHDIADARIAIQSRQDGDGLLAASTQFTPSRTKWYPRLLWLLTALVPAVVVALVLGGSDRPSAQPATRALISLEPATWLGSNGTLKSPDEHYRMMRRTMVLSPDGRSLVFSAGDDGGSRLYLRRWNDQTASPLPETEGGMGPFFSPDGSWIGFWADGKLKKTRLDGGSPLTICYVGRCPNGSSWGADDTIYFSLEGIKRVSAFGGAPEAIPMAAESWFIHPQLLPDGESLLLTERPEVGAGAGKIVVLSLATGEKKSLVENGANAHYSPTGHLVFARLGSLMAVPFNIRKLEVTGKVAVVLESVRQAVNSNNTGKDTLEAQFTFSATGTLVYIAGGVWPDPSDSLVWVDREGDIEPLDIPKGSLSFPRISPDGTEIVYGDWAFGRRHIWTHNIARNTETQLTFGEGVDLMPVWTPDGSTITFASDSSGANLMYSIPADRSGVEEPLSSQDGVVKGIPSSWSPDGLTLAFSLWSETGGKWGIWFLPPEGQARQFIDLPGEDDGAAFSPDGAWLAYRSQGQVFVTPFPGPGPKVQISPNGGMSPVWARNGREIFFRSSGRTMWAVPITTEPELGVGQPRELFDVNSYTTFPSRNYDVSPDGLRFVMVEVGPQQENPVKHLHVIFNWFSELNRLAPPD